MRPTESSPHALVVDGQTTVEQSLPHADLDGHVHVRRAAGVPVILDEPVWSAKQMLQIARLQVCDRPHPHYPVDCEGHLSLLDLAPHKFITRGYDKSRSSMHRPVLAGLMKPFRQYWPIFIFKAQFQGT